MRERLALSARQRLPGPAIYMRSRLNALTRQRGTLDEPQLQYKQWRQRSVFRLRGPNHVVRNDRCTISRNASTRPLRWRAALQKLPGIANSSGRIGSVVSITN